MKKVGKTTRPFRYDLNQIPYDYTVGVRNRFKGLDLIDRVPDELWMEVRDINRRQGSIILLGRKAMKSLDGVLKSKDITLPTKVHIVEAIIFPVLMYGYEIWTIEKAESQRIDKTLESPLDCKETKPANPKGNQPRIFIGRSDAEAETPMLWSPDAKN